jgi:hypothetical protein
MVHAGCVRWQAAVNRPELCQGLCLVTLSLRGLNIRKQSALIKPFVAALQRTLRETSLGVAFFNALAKPRTVKNVLRQAYAGNPDAVTDELVDFILTPGLQPGAAPVFLEFISFCTFAHALLRSSAALRNPSHIEVGVWRCQERLPLRSTSRQ